MLNKQIFFQARKISIQTLLLLFNTSYKIAKAKDLLAQAIQEIFF